jgi:hypothetical protein
MVLPLVVGNATSASDPRLSGAHAMHLAAASVVPVSDHLGAGLWATALHSAGYLLVTGAVALFA